MKSIEPAIFSSRDVDFSPETMCKRVPSSRLRKRYRPKGIEKADWNKRYTLFSRFDGGIEMDEAAWFEVTPENIAKYITYRIPSKCVIDGFCGVGGNSIQFAFSKERVIAVDLSADRVRMCQHNANIYGVGGRIQYVHSDVLDFLRKGDIGPGFAFYASPPWGGKGCYDSLSFSLDSFPLDLKAIIRIACERLGSLVLHLPRNMDLDDLAMFLGSIGIDYFEVERVFFTEPDRRLKCLFVYIDRSRYARDSVLQIGRQQRRLTISNFLGKSPSAILLTRACIQVSYLGRFISATFQTDSKRHG
jgi:16S rRNA G966 N2-methylase RsmD